MAIPNRNSLPKTEKSVQEIQNLSFDEDFNVLAIESLTFNPVTETLERSSAIQGNPSLTFSNDDTTPDSTKTITKTIGDTSYKKTLTYNAGGDLISISAWVEV